MADIEVQKHSVHTLVFRSLKRSHDMFIADRDIPPPTDEKSAAVQLACKARDEYGPVKDTVEAKKRKDAHTKLMGGDTSDSSKSSAPVIVEVPNTKIAAKESKLAQNSAIERYVPQGNNKALVQIGGDKMLVPRKAQTMPKPDWHPPWKLYRVVSGHNGWVRCVAFEPANEWFVTGAADRVIKIWDLASANLKLSLTGHVSTVRGVTVSARHPMLFSCGEDKMVKCWDLEYNKVIRHYHGHLSAVHSIDLHPTLDILATGGRDSLVRVWDMRTKAQIFGLAGHTNTVAEVRCQASEPQIVSGSHDTTIRYWDMVAGKSMVTLTNHKKSVRSVVIHPIQHAMCSASPDNIKQWKFPIGTFLQNLSGHNSIVNTLAINADNVLVSGGDNGSLFFWDWKTGYNFQRLQTTVQPGSMDSESGIFAANFDKSGSRLVTTEADKTIKIYKEDESASEETHPVNWRPNIIKKNKF